MTYVGPHENKKIMFFYYVDSLKITRVKKEIVDEHLCWMRKYVIDQLILIRICRDIGGLVAKYAF